MIEMFEFLFTVCLGFLPVIAATLIFVKLNGRRYILAAEITAFSLYLWLDPIRKIGRYPGDLLQFYIVAFMVVLLAAYLWLGSSYANTCLSTSILIVFTGSEAWEIPIFLRSLAGLGSGPVEQPLNFVYAIMSIVLAFRVLRLKPSLYSLVIFVVIPVVSLPGTLFFSGIGLLTRALIIGLLFLAVRLANPQNKSTSTIVRSPSGEV